MELGHHILPPVKGLGVGEVREGSGSGPHLDSQRPERETWLQPESALGPCEVSASSRAEASLLVKV